MKNPETIKATEDIQNTFTAKEFKERCKTMTKPTILIKEIDGGGSEKIIFAPYDPDSKCVYLDVKPNEITYTVLNWDGMERLPKKNINGASHTLKDGKNVIPDYIMTITPEFYKKRECAKKEGQEIKSSLEKEFEHESWKIKKITSGGYVIYNKLNGFRDVNDDRAKIIIKRIHPDDPITIQIEENNNTHDSKAASREEVLQEVQKIIKPKTVDFD